MFIINENLSNTFSTTEFIQLYPTIKDILVLNGAKVELVDLTSGNPTSPASATLVATLTGSAFNYPSNSSPAVPTPTLTSLDNNNLSIRFTLLQKEEPKLAKDVVCYLNITEGKYYLHVTEQTSLMKQILGHKSLTVLLDYTGALTVGRLRDIIAGTRSMFFMTPLDITMDVVKVKTDKADMDAYVEKLTKYIKMVKDAGFLFESQTLSSTDVEDKTLFILQARKRDKSKARRTLIRVEQYASRYEPNIHLNVVFEDQNDEVFGSFSILNGEPLLKELRSLDIAEADYIIDGINRAIADLKGYDIITDITP